MKYDTKYTCSNYASNDHVAKKLHDVITAKMTQIEILYFWLLFMFWIWSDLWHLAEDSSFVLLHCLEYTSLLQNKLQ